MKKAIKIIALLLLSSLVLFSLCACDGEDEKVTMSLAEFNKIKNGMTYEEVCKIVGGEGELLSSADLNIGEAYATEIYSWDGEGTLGANANVTFQGGKVITKAQFGLE